VAALVALAVERFGRLDVLIGNAGVMPVSAFDALRVEDWEAMVNVNIKGILYGIAAALPVFRAQGSGHFVHTASTSAFRTVPAAVARAIAYALEQPANVEVGEIVIRPTAQA
jgi:NADP-dependent 3-hydroxy acid dehydrogenase YdfG